MMVTNVLHVLIALLVASPTNANNLRRHEDGTATTVHRYPRRRNPKRGLQNGRRDSVIDVSLSQYSLQRDWSSASAIENAIPTGGNEDDNSEIETGGPFIGPEVFVDPKNEREGDTFDLELPVTKRIIGGQDADPHPFHSMLLLRYGGGWRWAGCGATLISNCHVVTAAHCAADPSKPLGAVFVNAHRPYQENAGLPFHFSTVQHVIRHAGYNATTNAHDIAVIKMDQCLNVTEFPPALPASPNMDIPTDLVADILGFGKLSETGNMFVNVQSLQLAEVPIIPRDTCKEYYSEEKIREDMFCAGFAEGGVDACQGDSGSSMTYVPEQGGSTVLIGVVSWGVGCGRSFSPGVYSSVQYHYDWLARQVCGDAETNIPWCSTYVSPSPTQSPSKAPTPGPSTSSISRPQDTTSSTKAAHKPRASNFYVSSSSPMVIAQSRMDSTSSATATIAGISGGAEKPDANVQFWAGCKPPGSPCGMGSECCSGDCRPEDDADATGSVARCFSPYPMMHRGTRGVRVKKEKRKGS